MNFTPVFSWKRKVCITFSHGIFYINLKFMFSNNNNNFGKDLNVNLYYDY